MSTVSLDIAAARQQLLRAPPTGVFDPAELEGLPEPVRRYFAASIVAGTPIATAASLRMRGQIRIRRWLPFRGEEVLAPLQGFVWQARAAGVISGHDAFADGLGEMQWKLLGLATVMSATGADIAKSGAGRCGGEGLWLPTALLPRFGVQWSALDDDHIVANFHVDTTPVELHCRIDRSGNVTSVVFDRWGDPDGSGTFAWHPFGGDITHQQTFNGLTIPSAGTWGWHHGTHRWSTGQFFRCRITGHRT